MSDRENTPDEPARVNPSESEELSDEALESVAGGCEIGCSNPQSCAGVVSMLPGIPHLPGLPDIVQNV